MGINQVVNFPFPTPPNQNNLKDAEKLLLNLEALDQDLKITKLGNLMAQFPVNPRYAKIIVYASKQSPDLLLYVIAIVSGLSVGEIFHRDLDLLIDKNADEDEDEDAKEERKQKRGNFYKKMQVLFHLTKLFTTSSPKSDCLTILRAIGAYISELSISRNQIEDFCRFHYLRPKAMEEVLKLMSQLIQLAKSCIGVNIEFNNRLQPPTSEQEGLILQVLLSGYGDCVAKLDESLMSGYGCNALPVYQTIWSSVEERFVIHPSSSLFRVRPCPKWIIFDQVQSKQENLGVEGDLIVQRISQDGTERKWMKIVSSIDAKWLNSLCKPQVNQGSLLSLPEPRYVPEEDSVIGFISPTFGPKFWELPVCEITLAKEEAVPWFARALLEGQITSPSSSKDLFKLLCGYLETKPSAVTKSWAKGQPRVINLLNELALADIYTKSSLLQKWKAEPKYLLSSYLLWVPSILHDKICELWPPCKLINGNCQINIKLVNELESILEKVQC
jgi:ATP-dependent RNA helicase DHX37/DHR1